MVTNQLNKKSGTVFAGPLLFYTNPLNIILKFLNADWNCHGSHFSLDNNKKP